MTHSNPRRNEQTPFLHAPLGSTHRPILFYFGMGLAAQVFGLVAAIVECEGLKCLGPGL